MKAPGFIVSHALVFLMATSLMAVGSESAAPVSRMTGCLTDEGSLVKMDLGRRPRRACSASETPVTLASGDITSIRTPGRGGLKGGVNSGPARVRLQKGFKLPQGCAPSELPVWTGAAWECTEVGTGNIGTIVPGLGLEGGGSEGEVVVGLQPGYALPQECGHAQVAKWTGTAWECGHDQDTNAGGDVTAVSAGTGLAGGGSSGDVTVALAETFRLPQSCGSAEIPVWDGAAWQCGLDADSGGDVTGITTPGAGGLQGGVDSGSASLSLQDSYKLPQGCAVGQLPKLTALGWSCGDDTDTTYDGTDFAESDQSCVFFSSVVPSILEYMVGIDEDGDRECRAMDLGFVINESLNVQYRVGTAVTIGQDAAVTTSVSCPSDTFPVSGGMVKTGGSGTFLVAMEGGPVVGGGANSWRSGLWNHDNQGSITAAPYVVCIHLEFPTVP